MEISETLKVKLAAAETPEEVIRLCAEEGIEITVEELKAALAAQDEELDESALDDVSGGIRIVKVVRAGAIGIGRLLGRKAKDLIKKMPG